MNKTAKLHKLLSDTLTPAEYSELYHRMTQVVKMEKEISLITIGAADKLNEVQNKNAKSD